MAEADPGSTGKKLSKSGDNSLEERNKSYNKVLDLQITYIKRKQSGQFDEIPNALFRWKQKAEWHEKTYGW